MSILRLQRRAGRGFTLIEVVIASVILAIVITGIAAFFMHIIRLSDRMDDRGRAVEICREGIETIRTQDILTWSDGWQTPSITTGIFTTSVWIDTPYPQYPEAKHVKCRVTWTGAAGADSLSLSTIL